MNKLLIVFCLICGAELWQVKNISSVDLSVNGKFIILDANSICAEIGDLMPYVNHSADIPYVYIVDTTVNQYFKLEIFPGSSDNEFCRFEVGNLLDSIVDATNYILYDSNGGFYSGKIHLGMTETDFIELNHAEYILRQENGIDIYEVIIDSTNSNILQLYNMPIYKACYCFDNNKLIKYYFGFDYP